MPRLDPSDLARVGLIARPWLGQFQIALATRLHQDFGSRIRLYCGSSGDARHFAERVPAGTFEAIIPVHNLYAAVMADPPSMDAVITEARERESRLGCTYNSLAVTDRHLGRGYALGGFRHPRSHQSEVSYLQMVHGFNRHLEFWEREIVDNALTLVVNGGPMPAQVARTAGIAFRTLAASRHLDLYYWAHTRFFENPDIEATYRDPGVSHSAPQMVDAGHITRHAVNRTRFLRHGRLLDSSYDIAMLVARHAYRRLKGSPKARSYYLTENLRYVVRRYHDTRAMMSPDLKSLSDLANHPFVFFPLATEPEMALQGLSPEYFCQLSSIAALSRDLPAGVKLAVKEHFFACGRRPADFYRQIGALKNVVMIRMDERGVDIVREALATVTITGSAGFEAAIMGKPVIVLGRHNIYNFLPHVFVVKDLGAFREAVDAALGLRGGSESTCAAGARFLGAIKSVSFDMRGCQTETESVDPDDPIVKDAVDSLARRASPMASTTL